LAVGLILVKGTYDVGMTSTTCGRVKRGGAELIDVEFGISPYVPLCWHFDGYWPANRRCCHARCARTYRSLVDRKGKKISCVGGRNL